MIKKMIFGTVLGLGLIFATTQNCFAQAKTQDELKAEREVLKAEMNSKEALARKAKFEKLTVPAACGLASVDGLSTSTGLMLVSMKEINTLVPEMYKRTIGESVDGVADVTVKKPTLDELLKLAGLIATQITSVATAASSISSVSGDIAKLSPFQIPKATKSLGFTKDALSLLPAELGMNLKVVNNLIATLKSSNKL
ncbi:MAG: hypothetical protein WCG08_11760 [Paludibacter sp.]